MESKVPNYSFRVPDLEIHRTFSDFLISTNMGIRELNGLSPTYVEVLNSSSTDNPNSVIVFRERERFEQVGLKVGLDLSPLLEETWTQRHPEERHQEQTEIRLLSTLLEASLVQSSSLNFQFTL